MNDLQAGSRLQHARGPFGAANNSAVHLDGDPGRIEPESGQETGDRLSFRDLAWFAIDDDFHICKYPVSGRPATRVDTPFG